MRRDDSKMSSLCEKCRNKSICKYCKEMEKIELDVSRIISNRESNSPIVLDLNCKRFEKKSVKSDGPCFR